MELQEAEQWVIEIRKWKNEGKELRLDDRTILALDNRIKKLEQGCRLLINIIPDDWDVPVLYGSAVNQVKELLEENK